MAILRGRAPLRLGLGGGGQTWNRTRASLADEFLA